MIKMETIQVTAKKHELIDVWTVEPIQDFCPEPSDELVAKLTQMIIDETVRSRNEVKRNQNG